MKVSDLTIEKINRGLKEKKFSVKEIVEGFSKNISEKEENIFAFLNLNENTPEKEIDDFISREKDFPLLTGVPCSLKDIIFLKGVKCTAGSKMLENYIAPYDATVVKKLKKEKSVILGKTNLDEFAMGSSTENSAFGPTRNPHDYKRVPGGSSGGSAASVASGECCFSLGSDTGGSVRQPASFCGVVGLKPTYGAVSRYGVIAFASSLDQVGPITKTVRDAEIVFNTIKGKDPLDSTSVDFNYSGHKDTIKIGVPEEYFVEGIDPGVKKVVESVLEKIGKKVKIEKISLPHTKYALASYYIIAPSEASSNLARYDGIRYGFSDKESDNLSDLYFDTRSRGFGKEVKKRLMIGTYSLSSGYYDEYYQKAWKVQRLIKRDFEKAFEKVDLIFTPTCPSTAFKIGEKSKDPISMILADIYTAPVNLAGLPAMSVPCGKSEGLPVGLQIIGKPFGENSIFEAGKLVEKII